MLETLASWHPFIVHFAVAFTIGSAFFDSLDFLRPRKGMEDTGFRLMLAALPFLLLAVLSGNLAESSLVNAPTVRAEQILLLEDHMTYANIAVWVFTAAAFWRIFLHFKGQFIGLKKVIYVFIVAAAAMSVFLAARKGGAINHDGRMAIVAIATAEEVHRP
jgi:uncharacterized membrane protein